MSQPLADALLMFLIAGLLCAWGCWAVFYQPGFLYVWMAGSPVAAFCIFLVGLRSQQSMADALVGGLVWGPVTTGGFLGALWLRLSATNFQYRVYDNAERERAKRRSPALDISDKESSTDV